MGALYSGMKPGDLAANDKTLGGLAVVADDVMAAARVHARELFADPDLEDAVRVCFVSCLAERVQFVDKDDRR